MKRVKRNIFHEENLLNTSSSALALLALGWALLRDEVASVLITLRGTVNFPRI